MVKKSKFGQRNFSVARGGATLNKEDMLAYNTNFIAKKLAPLDDKSRQTKAATLTGKRMSLDPTSIGLNPKLNAT